MFSTKFNPGVWLFNLNLKMKCLEWPQKIFAKSLIVWLHIRKELEFGIGNWCFCTFRSQSLCFNLFHLTHSVQEPEKIIDIRVAKCHVRYDRYIRVEIFIAWGRKLGEHAILQNQTVFGKTWNRRRIRKSWNLFPFLSLSAFPTIKRFFFQDWNCLIFPEYTSEYF